MNDKAGFPARKEEERQGRHWLFCGKFCHAQGMDKVEHGLRLKAAMSRAGHDRTLVADYVGVGVRTVTNWTSGKTMPSVAERDRLAELLGGYAEVGDPVEVAIRQSDLAPFRQTKVIGFYQEQVYEQGREVRGA